MTAKDRIITGYYNLIKSNRIALEQIPEKWRAEVSEKINNE